MNYKNFQTWFDEIQPKVRTEFNCPDPFEKSKIIQKWLEIAYNLGFDEGKNFIVGKK